jgi:hypothetical protein
MRFVRLVCRDRPESGHASPVKASRAGICIRPERWLGKTELSDKWLPKPDCGEGDESSRTNRNGLTATWILSRPYHAQPCSRADGTLSALAPSVNRIGTPSAVLNANELRSQ